MGSVVSRIKWRFRRCVSKDIFYGAMAMRTLWQLSAVKKICQRVDEAGSATERN